MVSLLWGWKLLDDLYTQAVGLEGHCSDWMMYGVSPSPALGNE